MPPTCPINSQLTSDEPTKKAEWTEYDKTYLAQLAENRAKAFASLSQQLGDPAQQIDRAIAQSSQTYWETITSEVGKALYLSPQKAAPIRQWLADNLGVKLGVIADVREPIRDIKNIVDGLLRETSTYNMIKPVQDLKNLADEIAVKYGVKLDAEDFRRIQEQGMIPVRLAAWGNTPNMQAALDHQYNEVVADFLNRGIPQAEIDDLMAGGYQIAKQWDASLAVARSVDYDVNTLTNMGYFPRIAEPDAKPFFEQIDTLKNGVEMFTPEGATKVLAKSRGTWNYLPEDHLLTSHLLGVTEDELTQLINNPRDFAQFLSKTVTSDQLDLLVDSGIMSKIPMTGQDVAEFLIESYKIPLTSTELFIADPLRASQAMAQRLQLGAERSAVVKFVSSEGLKQGWAVPSVSTLPEFDNYIPLSSIDGLNITKGAANDVKVHPIVADNMKGILKLAGKPAELSNLAQIYKQFTSFLAKQWLGNPLGAATYLSHQFMSNAIQVAGRGVSVIHYGQSVIDMMRLAKFGLATFDDTKPYRYIDGKALTHRELVAKTVRLFNHNILPDLNVVGGNSVVDFSKLNPLNAWKLYNTMKHYPGYEGDFKTLAKAAGGYLNDVNDTFFTPSIKMASFLDMGSQLAIVRARSSMSPVANLGDELKQFAPTLHTWDELTKEVKSAMPFFDDVGNASHAASRIFPFIAWSMQNLPIQLRDMMKSPSKWGNYGRMHQLFNNAMLQQNPSDVPAEGEFQDWHMQDYPFLLGRDAANKQTVIVTTSNYDPLWGTITTLANNAEGIATKLGKSPRSQRQIREDALGESPSFLADFIGKSYFKDTVKLFTKQDPFTGQKLDDSEFAAEGYFLNIPMPQTVAAILSVVPALNRLDKLEWISGTKDLKDPRTGNQVIEGANGWLGNSGKVAPVRLQQGERVAQLLLSDIRYVDGLQNMQFSEAQARTALQKVVDTHRKQRQDLKQQVMDGRIKQDSPEYLGKVQTLNRMIDAAIQINFDLARTRLWMRENGLPSKDILKEVRNRNMAISDIPMPGAEYTKKALEQASEMGYQPEK